MYGKKEQIQKFHFKNGAFIIIEKQTCKDGKGIRNKLKYCIMSVDYDNYVIERYYRQTLRYAIYKFNNLIAKKKASDYLYHMKGTTGAN